MVALLLLSAVAMAVPPGAHGAESGIATAEVADAQYFEPLEHNIVDVAGTLADGSDFRADFLANYTRTGGIERWGYPTSAIVEERSGTLTQYYQRGVIDWQPPPDGGAPTFLRRLAWDYLGGGLGGSIDQGVEPHLTNPNPGELLGPWGHKVSNLSVEGEDIGFADFFHRLGGVASFGFPKTDARQDDHPEADLHIPGRPPDSRIRQYFQAAALEYHPESAGAPVQLRLLGDTLRDSRYPYRAWQQYLAFGPEAPLAVGDQLDLGLESRRGPYGSTPEDVARFVELSLLRVATDQACGTGFVVTASGYAVIPWHLALDAATFVVTSPRGYTANAQFVAGYAQQDFALIKVEGDGHIPVEWGSAEDLAQATGLVAIGYDATSAPGGRAVECRSEPTATPLIAWLLEPGQPPILAPVLDAGNGGGPVATTAGRVVGMAASVSPETQRLDSLFTASEAQALVNAWLDDIARGVAPARSVRPLFDRFPLLERASIACPRDAVAEGRYGEMALSVRGGSIELTADVWLNPAALSFARLRFEGTVTPFARADIIVFGEYYDYMRHTRQSISWVRLGADYEGDRTFVKRFVHPDIVDDVVGGARFHLRFIYDRNSVALFINGEAVHHESGLQYGDDITLNLGCTGPDQPNSIYYYNVRVTGHLIPST
ncbi:MAG: serine protease [Chloroflexi bacterium]|nr:serine protease [Chloroflexota bacterium]